MPNALAHPEQPQSPATRLPLFAQAGRDAAALWLTGAPLSMADFRDMRLRNLLAGLGHFEDLAAHTAEFNGAYAQRIGQAIARKEVCHG